MSYNVKIPISNTDHIFGVAYPHLKLSPLQKSKFIRSMATLLLDEVGYACVVDLDHTGKMFNVEILITGRKGYDAALKIESHFSAPPRGINISNWWNRATSGAMPFDTYLLEPKMYERLLEWIKGNIKPCDYQIYSRFGGDFSIGFQNESTATMFKLVFAEENI